jgi:hypothetical protein
MTIVQTMPSGAFGSRSLTVSDPSPSGSVITVGSDPHVIDEDVPPSTCESTDTVMFVSGMFSKLATTPSALVQVVFAATVTVTSGPAL